MPTHSELMIESHRRRREGPKKPGKPYTLVEGLPISSWAAALGTTDQLFYYYWKRYGIKETVVRFVLGKKMRTKQPDDHPWKRIIKDV